MWLTGSTCATSNLAYINDSASHTMSFTIAEDCLYLFMFLPKTIKGVVTWETFILMRFEPNFRSCRKMIEFCNKFNEFLNQEIVIIGRL